MPNRQTVEVAQIMCPALGEGIAKARVACWHVSVGDHVRAGDDVVEVVTDKAAFSIETDVSGVIEAILVEKGSEVPVGGCLATVKTREQG